MRDRYKCNESINETINLTASDSANDRSVLMGSEIMDCTISIDERDVVIRYTNTQTKYT